MRSAPLLSHQRGFEQTAIRGFLLYINL